MGSPHSSNGVEYRPIEGFPGYEVGIDGSVRSRRVRGHADKLAKDWRWLTPVKDGDDHLRVVLYRNTVRHPRFVHHLVLETFRGHRPDGTQACHRNGVPWDNRLSNLRWGTAKENAADREEHGRTARGNKHGVSKLREEDIPEIRELISTGVPQREVARRFGVAKGAIGFIVSGKTWKHVN
jgi:hypothetical protein